MGDRQAWRAMARCAGIGLTFNSAEQDFFFIQPGQKSKRAKDFCKGCPVKRECLEFALIYDEVGIWGGKTDAERREFPDFLVQALREREANTVGLESRNLEDFIPLQYRTSQEDRQDLVEFGVVEIQVQVMVEGSSALTQESLAEQLRALDRLFEQTNVLLQSFPLGPR